MLEIEEPSRTLDIRQRRRPSILKPLEDLARGNGPLELPDKLFKVMLNDPV